MIRLDSILLVAEATKKLSEYIALRKRENTWSGSITKTEFAEIGIDKRLHEVLKRRNIFTRVYSKPEKFYGFTVEFDSIEEAEYFSNLMASKPEVAVSFLETYETLRQVYRYEICEETLNALIEINQQDVYEALKSLSAYR